MPCVKHTVNADLKDKMHLVKLSSFVSQDELNLLRTNVSNLAWNEHVPGGFVHNTPKRLVNAFGDGSGYDASSHCIGESWDTTAWTAAIHSNDVTLLTNTEPLPHWLQAFGCKCRAQVEQCYNIKTTPFHFSVAVCNKYIKGEKHEIAAHTDDNEWYLPDLESGPMFASLTLYNTIPASAKEHARFQVCFDGKWEDFVLPDASVLFMPSCIPHRILSNPLAQTRTNITLRSIPSVQSNPLLSFCGVANHARYYRIPHELIIPKEKEITELLCKIVKGFYSFARNNKQKLTIRHEESSSEIRKKLRITYINTLKKRNVKGTIRCNVTTWALSKVASVLC